MRGHTICLLISASLAGLAAVEGQTSAASTTPNDELAWKTLAEVSKPPNNLTNATGGTPLSWRLWWTSQDVYGSPPKTNTAGAIYPLACKAESERPASKQPKNACEVVFLNGISVNYVGKYELWRREKLVSAAKAGTISFPQSPNPPAVEMKTEWQLKSESPTGQYVEGVDSSGGTRVLVAFHMMIKAFDNWLWATYIHERFLQRVSEAGATPQDVFGYPGEKPSAALQTLLNTNNAGVLGHYRLIGTQVDFTTLLGNPLIEDPDDIKAKNISCISCHSFAAIQVDGLAAGGTAPISIVPGKPNIPSQFHPVNFNFTLALHAKCQFIGLCSPAVQSPQ